MGVATLYTCDICGRNLKKPKSCRTDLMRFGWKVIEGRGREVVYCDSCLKKTELKITREIRLSRHT